jgi:hypothetical protein
MGAAPPVVNPARLRSPVELSGSAAERPILAASVERRRAVQERKNNLMNFTLKGYWRAMRPWRSADKQSRRSVRVASLTGRYHLALGQQAARQNFKPISPVITTQSGNDGSCFLSSIFFISTFGKRIDGNDGPVDEYEPACVCREALGASPKSDSNIVAEFCIVFLPFEVCVAAYCSAMVSKWLGDACVSQKFPRPRRFRHNAMSRHLTVVRSPRTPSQASPVNVQRAPP